MIVADKEETGKRKIVRIENKEATFSRWSEMNPETFRIEWHYYYAYWGEYEPDGDERKVFATPVLNPKTPGYFSHTRSQLLLKTLLVLHY